MFPWRNFNNVDRVRNLQQTFEGINIDNNMNYDLNGNNTGNVLHNFNFSSHCKRYCVPADIIKEHFSYLPQFIRRELGNGPLSRCDNAECKRPIFDYVFYEFCFG